MAGRIYTWITMETCYLQLIELGAMSCVCVTMQEEDWNRQLHQTRPVDVRGLPYPGALRLQWHHQAPRACSGPVTRGHEDVHLCHVVSRHSMWRLWECVEPGHWEWLCNQWHLWNLQGSEPPCSQWDRLGGEWDLWMIMLLPARMSLSLSANASYLVIMFLP